MGCDPPPAPMSVAAVLRDASERLRRSGVADPAGDARRLLCEALSCDRAALIADQSRCVSASEATAYGRMIARRAAREPVARIVGRRAFYGRDFVVTPGVLEPRPDTETLIEEALALVRREALGAEALSILDIGCGSGIILLTLLAELPTASGLGIDVSPEALDCSLANARRLGLEGRARFVSGDLASGLPEGFTLWVSNPPYIRSDHIVDLEPEVRDYDPLLALDGGPDGLEPYRGIARALEASGTEGYPRWLLVEVGAGDGAAVADLFTKRAPFVSSPGSVRMRSARQVTARVVPDIDGRDRCVVIGSTPT